MTESVDLVVVGAGIAGASTACFAARAGLRVVVVGVRPADVRRARVGSHAARPTDPGARARGTRPHVGRARLAHSRRARARRPGPERVPGLFVLTGGNGKGFKFGPPMGRALARIVGGADFAASPLARFAVDREARGQTIRGEHEYDGARSPES